MTNLSTFEELDTAISFKGNPFWQFLLKLHRQVYDLFADTSVT